MLDEMLNMIFKTIMGVENRTTETRIFGSSFSNSF